MFKSLLPRNSTSTERVIEEVMSFSPTVEALPQHLRCLRSTRPATLAPWLMSEWDIADFRQYFDSDAACFDVMLPWLRKRGTAEAVKIALGVIGEHDAQVDVDDFLLSITLKKPFAGKLKDLHRAVSRSIPLHLDFYRMQSGASVNAGTYDKSCYDTAAYDDDAGYTVDGLKISYTQSDSAMATTIALAMSCSAQEHKIFNRVDLWCANDKWAHRTWCGAIVHSVVNTQLKEQLIWSAAMTWKPLPWLMNTTTRVL